MKYYNLSVRLWVIILAILTSFCIFQILLVPKLESLCILKTNSCIQIEYKQFKNSVLFHMLPTGYWAWFDGKFLFIYQQATGNTCPGSSHAAYAYNVKKRKRVGYLCAKPLDDVKDFYKDQKMKYIYLRQEKGKQTSVYDVINIMSDRNIIKID